MFLEGGGEIEGVDKVNEAAVSGEFIVGGDDFMGEVAWLGET